MGPVARGSRIAVLALAVLACGALGQVAGQQGAEAALPAGVKAVWDIEKAYREATPTRERVCINGLWRWQPAADAADAVPAGGWGYFKVPGSWPGITNYMQKDSQTVYAHPSWEAQSLREITAAWYQREITVPAEWAGRRITICAEYLNSFASVYLDGRKVGDMRFPAGEVDITSACRPGGKHVLSMCVLAMPLRAVMLSYSDTVATREVRGTVARRGLCGDVHLIGTPSGARIADVKVDTSVRKWEISFDAALDGLDPNGRYALRARITDDGRSVGEFTSKPFRAADLEDGRIAFTQPWKPEKLWDIHTPQNMYQVSAFLLDGGGKVLDAALPVRFGFRELWIDGRDFYLNGSRVFLSAVQYNNAQVGAALANYGAERETMKRLKSFGINFIYGGNYGCEPGTHLSFEEELRAADDVGMLVSFSQPHFSRYNWDAPDADESNGYAQHAESYVRVAQNHPSVVFYSTSHNATGYDEDMNPDLIDGAVDRSAWSGRNEERALRAEAIIKRLDPSRVVYHHSSGNLSSMHTSNFYANWVPIQEMSDWFEHWATVGVKPLFTCEYGTPGTTDWTMYRGWYKGKREFGSAVVPWEYCLAEWNAQLLGDRAYQISEVEKRNLRWEAEQFRAGKLWHRWDYPHQVGTTDINEQYYGLGVYTWDNWRAFRTWGISANSPWQYGAFWQLRPGVDRRRREEFKVDWDDLQRPGLSPDYIEERYLRMDLTFEPSDWVPTAVADALYRNNMPLLAYIGGKPAAFTSKDHNFLPGETVEKQIIVINNCRETVTAECQWSLGLPRAVTGSKTITLPTGQQERIPLRFELPASLAPGQYELSATVRFNTGETQEDSFSINVMPRPSAPPAVGEIALFDPKGETAELLKGLGVRFDAVDANADLSPYDTLIIGKAALTLDGPAPNIARVRDGLKVIVFEQTGEVLEKRFGFRVAEYGLRWVFKRVPDHPLLAGLADEHLRNWRGDATVLPPRIEYELHYGPTVKWCDIPVKRVWRCGNRGNVASALIEKPACGDFLPILDGGYALQYAALMEYREGTGMVLFCQTDVTGRTENDPAADTLAGNILQYVSHWKPAAGRQAVYVGDPAGKSHLESAGLALGPYEGGRLSADQVLVVGPGGGKELARDAGAVAGFVKAGGNLLAIGLDQDEANAFLPLKVAMKKEEHIAAYFEPIGAGSLLAGVSPAEVHNRDPRELSLVSVGAMVIGDGVLAQAQDANVVFCQFAPWQFDYSGEKMNVKRTFRKVSCLLSRLLGNMGASGTTRLLEHVSRPVAEGEKRWLDGLYLDVPEEWDDPYRFFRW